MVVGLAIGSGIFRTPASIAARVPDPLADAGRVAGRRRHLPLRRAVGGRAVGRAAAHGRLVRVPARGLGTAAGLPLRLGPADPAAWRRHRRDRRRVRRILPPVGRRGQPGPSAGGAARQRRRHRGRRRSQHPRRRARRSRGRRGHGGQVQRAGADGRLGGPARQRLRRAALYNFAARAPVDALADRPGADLRAVGLRRVRRRDVGGGRGDQSAAQSAARDRPGHDDDHRRCTWPSTSPTCT